MLRMWIDTSATYPGTYASLGCGTYRPPISHGGLSNRCASCHIAEAGPALGVHFGPGGLIVRLTPQPDVLD